MRRLVSMVLSICAMAVFMPAWALAVEESGQAALKAPTVTAFYVVYQDGEKTKEISLLSGDEQQQELILPASTQYTFVVRFDRVEQLDAVYITSTKEDDTKYLEATYDVDANAYIADGAFDSDDANYIPGTLSVSYSQKPVCVTTSDVIAAGVDLNAVKVETDKQGIFSSQSEITGQEGTATAQVVLGEMISGITDASVDATISTLVAGSDIEESELIEWLGVYKDLTETVSYQLKGEDEDYTLYLDPDNLLSGNTVLLVVQDVAGHQYTKLVLKKATDNLGWGEIADSLSDVNKIGTALLDYCGISKEATELKEEVEASTTMTNAQKEEAYQKIQALESDKKLFLIGNHLPSLVCWSGFVGRGWHSSAAVFCAYERHDGCIRLFLGLPGWYDPRRRGLLCGTGSIWNVWRSLILEAQWRRGTLTISGHGPMTEFGTIYQVPWVSYAQAQKKRLR